MIDWKKTLTSKPTKEMLQECSTGVRAMSCQWDSLGLKDGLLYRAFSPKYDGTMVKHQLVAPLCLRKQIFHYLHATPNAGHLGITRTVAAIKMRFYWVGCKSDVTRWMRQCDSCAQVKPGPKFRARLVQSSVSSFLERIAIDIVGPLPTTERGNTYILSITDYFTKWAQAYELVDQTAQSVADVLSTRFISVFGAPSILHSDQGRNFESKLFQQLCKTFGILKTRTSPYNPKSDGLCERWNKTMQQMLKSLANENKDDWDLLLPFVVMGYNSTPQASTGLSPRLMVFGDEMPVPLDVMVGKPPGEKPYACETEYIEWLRQTLNKAHEHARKNLKRAALIQKSRYDKCCRPPAYKPGQFVWRWYPPAANKKLGKGWKGVYRVVACPTEVNCQIQLFPNDEPIMVYVEMCM